MDGGKDGKKAWREKRREEGEGGERVNVAKVMRKGKRVGRRDD